MKTSEMFIYESPDIPEMVELREKYSLEKVISRKKNEFDKFIALRKWVQKQWRIHGYDQIPEKNDSLKILEAAGKGKLFQCWYYATVYVQCATSLGFKARRLGIGINPVCVRPGNTGHIVSEIWSEDLKKWIIMDADANCHYECDRVPQGALEIHNIWVSHQLQKIKYIQGSPVPKMISKFNPEKKASQFVFGAYDILDYYFKIQMELRNNWFSSDKGTKPGAISWIDKYHPDYSDKVGKVIDNVLWTDNPEMFLESPI